MFHLIGWLFSGILGIACTIFWIIMIIDVVRRNFSSTLTKIVWLLIVIFTHIVGAVIYFFIGRPMGTLAGQI